MPEIESLVLCTQSGDALASPAYLGNGFVGLRPGIQPLAPCTTVVAGYTECAYHPNNFEIHALAPYPLMTEIAAGGLSLRAGDCRILGQSLNMACGELTTQMRFGPLNLTVVQFVSRTLPTLCCQELHITAEEDCEAELLPGCDFSKVNGRFEPFLVYDNPHTRHEQVWLGGHDRARLGICVTASLQKVEQEVPPVARGRYVVHLGRRERAVFRTIASLMSEFYATDCHLEAKRQTSLGLMIGFEALRQRNRDAWAQLWRSRIVLKGDDRARFAQHGLDVAFYGLMSSCHPQSMTGVAPFGLSKYHDYGGHIFWDMDTWISHAVLPIAPDLSRAMAEKRIQDAPAARKQAARYGYAGLQYPWEAGINGEDATPAEADTGWGEHHVTPDVAVMLWEQCMASRDEDFVRQEAWPVLAGIARWVVSRGRFTPRGFEIWDVVGVDEFSSSVKNNAHMNLLCRMALQAAVLCAQRVGAQPEEAWEKAYSAMVLPFNDQGALIPHESARMKKESDQYAPGSAHFAFLHAPELYGALDMKTFERTWEFDEQMCQKLPPSPSNPCSTASPGFTTPVFAATAAFFGQREKAAELFETAFREYACPPYDNTKEYRKYTDGVYITNYAAQIQAVLYGLCGLRVRPGDWRMYPTALPAGWEEIRVERLFAGAGPVRLVARHGEMAELTSCP